MIQLFTATTVVVAFLAIARGAAVRASPVGHSNATCGEEQWRCGNGDCIPAPHLCDGSYHCADRSDENYQICFQQDWLLNDFHRFRCAYGAYVSEEFVCNGERDCVDNSDESLPKCRSGYKSQYLSDFHGENFKYADLVRCNRSQFECWNGDCIDKTKVCDGVVDCYDTTDETALACSFDRMYQSCPRQAFRCTYGACISRKLMCDGMPHCLDGSDEDAQMCSYRKYPTANSPFRPAKACQRVPDHPEYGFRDFERVSFVIPENFTANPDRLLYAPDTQLFYYCRPGFRLVGNNYVTCQEDGSWSAVPYCALKPEKPTTQKPLNDHITWPHYGPSLWNWLVIQWML